MVVKLISRRPVLFLLGFTALIWWKLLFAAGDFTFLDSPDLSGQVLPWYQVQAKSWNEGVFPLWDPYVWGGQPLIGQMQPGTAFPLNWPLFAAPLKSGKINLRFIHWHYALMHLLAAWFAYGLAREIGLSRFSSVFAGLGWASSGYIATIGWPQMLNGAVWAPLSLLLLHRLARAELAGEKAACTMMCGGSIGLSFLSGHHQAPFFSLLAVCGLCLYFLAQKARSSRAEALSFAGLFGAVAAVAFLAAALQLIPAWEYGTNAYRWIELDAPVKYPHPVPLAAHAEQRVYPFTLIGLVIPRVFMRADVFVGWTALCLALFAVGFSWRERWTRVYSLMGLGALAFCFGPHSLLHGWIYGFVPLADKARTPAYAVFLFELVVFLLAGRGLDLLLRLAVEERARKWVLWTQRVLLGFAAFCGALLTIDLWRGTMGANPGDWIAISACCAALLAALMAAYQRGAIRASMFQLALTALMVFEISCGHWYFISDRKDPGRRQYVDRYEQYRGVAAFLKGRQEQERFRFELIPDGGTTNMGAWEGLESVDGFLASVSADVFELHRNLGWRKARMLLNTVYTVAKEQQHEEQQQLFADPNGWKVFRNSGAGPRAWLSRSVEFLSADEGVGEPRSLAECGGEDRVSYPEWSLNRTLIRVEAACEGYLIVADPYFPGWTAEIDGSPLTIYRAYQALRAVRVPRGESTVKFLYQPRSVYLGGALSALGLTLFVGALVFSWRRGWGLPPEAEKRAET